MAFSNNFILLNRDTVIIRLEDGHEKAIRMEDIKLQKEIDSVLVWDVQSNELMISDKNNIDIIMSHGNIYKYQDDCISTNYKNKLIKIFIELPCGNGYELINRKEMENACKGITEMVDEEGQDLWKEMVDHLNLSDFSLTLKMRKRTILVRNKFKRKLSISENNGFLNCIKRVSSVCEKDEDDEFNGTGLLKHVLKRFNDGCHQMSDSSGTTNVVMYREMYELINWQDLEFKLKMKEIYSKFKEWQKNITITQVMSCININ